MARNEDMDAAGRNRRTDAAARRAAAMPDIVAGKGASEVARLHGVSETTVRRWMLEVRGQFLDETQAAIEKIRGKLPRIVDRLLELTESADEKVALGAVNSALDRTGLIKVQRHEVDDVTQPKTMEEARAMVARIAAALGTGDEPDEEGGEDE